jgi:hypothetical protein
MNRDQIQKTALCRYDPKDKTYSVKSPLLNICEGIAKTEKAAREIFDDLLDAMYIKYLEGKEVGRYEKRGRPSAGKVELHVTVKPGTRDTVFKLSVTLGCKQGEVIDYLAGLWRETAQPAKRILKTGVPRAIAGSVAKKRPSV